MKISNLRNLNTEALAYMGDAAYELFIREMLLKDGMAKVKNLHRAATMYVKAASQAKAVKQLMDTGELSEEEIRLVKRARNHKFNSKAKNADAITYKWATAFEALIGFLYLDEQNERMEYLMRRAVEITKQTDGARNQHGKQI